MNLKETVNLIQTREDFVAFLHELLHDLRTKPAEWENISLEDYLEAMAAWTEDSDGYYINHGLSIPQHPSWKTLGEILLATKYQE